MILNFLHKACLHALPCPPQRAKQGPTGLNRLLERGENSATASAKTKKSSRALTLGIAGLIACWTLVGSPALAMESHSIATTIEAIAKTKCVIDLTKLFARFAKYAANGGKPIPLKKEVLPVFLCAGYDDTVRQLLLYNFYEAGPHCLIGSNEDFARAVEILQDNNHANLWTKDFENQMRSANIPQDKIDEFKKEWMTNGEAFYATLKEQFGLAHTKWGEEKPQAVSIFLFDPKYAAPCLGRSQCGDLGKNFLGQDFSSLNGTSFTAAFLTKGWYMNGQGTTIASLTKGIRLPTDAMLDAVYTLLCDLIPGYSAKKPEEQAAIPACLLQANSGLPLNGALTAAFFNAKLGIGLIDLTLETGAGDPQELATITARAMVRQRLGIFPDAPEFEAKVNAAVSEMNRIVATLRGVLPNDPQAGDTTIQAAAYAQLKKIIEPLLSQRTDAASDSSSFISSKLDASTVASTAQENEDILKKSPEEKKQEEK
jgi:hypothetical protein